MSRFAFFASSPIDVTDSKPTRIRIAMHAWMIMNEKLCGRDHGLRVGVELERRDRLLRIRRIGRRRASRDPARS